MIEVIRERPFISSKSPQPGIVSSARNFYIASATFLWGVSAAVGRAVFTGKLRLGGALLHPIDPLILSQTRSTFSLLVLLPLLGIVLNGTSSVLYGTVPDLAPKGNLGRAFAMFYSGVIGAGALAPIVYGAIADHSSRSVGIWAAALTAAVIVPLVLVLRPHLAETRAAVAETRS